MATLMDPTTPLPCKDPCKALTCHDKSLVCLIHINGVSIHVICSSEQRLELAVAMSDAVIPLSRSVKLNLYISLHTLMCILAAYITFHAVS